MSQVVSIGQFYNEIVKLMSQPASEVVPSNSLYPVSDPPSLLVFLGPTREIPAIRAQLPECCFLFGLYAQDEMPVIKGEGRTLLCPLISSSDYVEKTGLLVSVLTEKKVRLIANPHYEERFADQYKEIQKTIKSAVDNGTSEERRGLIRLRAACFNLNRMLMPTRIAAKPIDHSIPAILCGAGPSLNKHLDALRDVHSKVVLVAVGHAVRTLHSAGITPDIIVEGDSLAGRNWPEGLSSDSLLVATAEVAPEVAGRFDKIVWCAGSSFIFNNVATKYKVHLTGVTLDKTVSIHALDFMLRLGFRKIALVGQDYCLADDGRVYAEESKSSDSDEIFELPSAVGDGFVKTNHTLRMLWKSMSRYLENMTTTIDCELVNASGGARLPNTTADDLVSWSESFGCIERPELFSDVDNEADPTMITEVLTQLKSGSRAIDAVLKACRYLDQEVDRFPPRMSQLRKRQQEVEQTIAAEHTLRSAYSTAPWLHNCFQITDKVLQETPGVMTNDPDPHKQLNYLMRRYAMAKRLYQDIISSIENVEMPNKFSAFFQENLAAIRNNNKELAVKLAEIGSDISDQYDIHWINQIVPYVKRKREDGEWQELSGFISIFKEAATAVEAFIEEHQFDPDHDALIVACPGNWVYVLEWVKRYPNIQLSVIELWPDLMAQLIWRGCFLHRLPEDCLVVENWMNQDFMNRCQTWKQAGRRCLHFVNKHVAEFPDVKILASNLKVVL